MNFNLVCTVLVLLLFVPTISARSIKSKLCPDGSYPFQCFEQPCRVRKCPNYPNATCEDDYCGGCNARFYINKRQDNCIVKVEVTEDCKTCKPPVNQCEDPDNCPINPCDPRLTSCDNFSQATCYADYCESCTDRWFLPDCTEVTCACKKTSDQS